VPLPGPIRRGSTVQFWGFTPDLGQFCTGGNISQVLPKLDGVVTKLQAAVKAADIGCGAGVALVEMAEAFPQSAFNGYDISQHALARAEANKKRANAKNLIFHDAAGRAGRHGCRAVGRDQRPAIESEVVS